MKESFDLAAVQDLLAVAKSRNKDLGITGMLLYADGSFFQVLEGDEQVVDKLFARISQDDRHDHIVTIINEPIGERDFENWSMGYATSTSSELNKIDGMNDFFGKRTCLTDVDAGRAKLLLSAFAEGRWRLPS